ncbi:MAG: exopolyphosphatase [Clostridiaceae bacterium]|nr:exopolyphosphatase [Clostridiaceae bacterium]
MAVITFAAIDVGSHQTSLRIYEISKQIGTRELDYVYHTSRLGYETYSTNHISSQSINTLCTILNGFSDKMKEYSVADYMITATSALREADNNLIVLDQVKQRTGFQIKILSNSEQRFLFYKAIALKENTFHRLIQKGTLLIDIGGGSLQLSLFDKSAMIATQNILLGPLRINETLEFIKNSTDNYLNLIYEYISHDLHAYRKMFLKNIKVKNIIVIGNQLPSFIQYLSTHNFDRLLPVDARGSKKDSVNRSEYEEFYRSMIAQKPEELGQELNISLEQASLLIPTAMICHNIFEKTQAEQMWLSDITICDGIAADFAERKIKLVPAHNFTNDILSAARRIAERYQYSVKHTAAVESTALKIFDAVKKQNHLTKQDRLMLQIAAILHTCGAFINVNDIGENTYKIVTSTEIIGISHKQRMMVATVVRYLKTKFPQYSHLSDSFEREEYIKITKLNAILCLADAMDRSHLQKFKKITVVLRRNILYVTGHSLYDIALEQGIFSHHGDFFAEVFGITPLLKQKKDF